MYFYSFLLLALTFAFSHAVQVGFIGNCVDVISSNESCGCDEHFINTTWEYKKIPAADSYKNVTHMFQYNRRVGHGVFHCTAFAKQCTDAKYTVYSDRIYVMHGANGHFIGKPVRADDADVEFCGQILWCSENVLYFFLGSPDGADSCHHRCVVSTTGCSLTAEEEAKISEIDKLNNFNCDMKCI